MKKLSKIIWLLIIALPHFCNAQLSTQIKREPLAADSLIGTWSMSATEHIWINKSYKSQTTQATTRIVCNACPVVTFDANHTGQLMSANGFKQTFEWSIDGGELKVVNYTPKKIKPDSILRNGIYSAGISQGSLGEDVLRLLDTTVTTYVLVKKYL